MAAFTDEMTEWGIRRACILFDSAQLFGSKPFSQRQAVSHPLRIKVKPSCQTSSSDGDKSLQIRVAAASCGKARLNDSMVNHPSYPVDFN
jgi:hypothetical protein